MAKPKQTPQEEKQEKKISLPWTRIHTDWRNGLRTIDPALVGNALILALDLAAQYGEGADEIRESISDPMEKFVFGLFEQGVYESVEAHGQKRAAGRARAAQMQEKLQEKERQINKLLLQNQGIEPTPTPPDFMEESKL